MKKKIIVTDLDGTLLHMDKTCPTASKEYLKSLKEKEHIVVIATGRSLGSLLWVTKGADFANYLIADCGSFIYNNSTKTILYDAPIEIELVKKICSYYDSSIIHHIDICDQNYYYQYTDEEVDCSSYLRKVDSLESLFAKKSSFYHLSIIFKSNEFVFSFLERLKKEVGALNYQVMQDSYGKKKWIDISAIGTSKYKAIQMIAQKENVDNSDILAFGDGLNDIEMIKNVGVGVAMENALEEVRKVSSFTTLSHEKDGVIHFLKDYFPY